MKLEERIIQTLANNLQKKVEIKPESRLVEDLLLDSFDGLMIISALEDEFSVTLNIQDLSEFTTVGDIIEKFRQSRGEE